MVGKRAAFIGEQAVEAGPDLRPRGVEPYSRALTGERLGLEEPAFDIASRAAGASEETRREGVPERKGVVARKGVAGCVR